MPRLIVVAGPTASGKSALALRLAADIGGEIVNADSMQLYRDLRVLTARPSRADEGRVPHHLFGILAADEPASVGRWLTLAERVVGRLLAAGRPAVVVGGTGLYLHALLHGLAPVPDVPPGVRAATRARAAAAGCAGIHADLGVRDPAMAARLRPGDRQRLLRAHEVRVATGRSLAVWQALPRQRAEVPTDPGGIVLMPPRDPLRARIADRLGQMVEAGGLAEVAALHARGLARDLPLMKAVGVPELLAHLDGRIDLATALARATVQTHRYAKRQRTWLRHQLPEFPVIAGFGDDTSESLVGAAWQAGPGTPA